MCECKREELKEEKDKAIDNLDTNIEKYLERYETIVEEKEEVLARAEYAAVQTITNSTVITTEQTPKLVNSLDKFTAYTELKPKFLEKESTLLEVTQWTRQASLYISAGYKTVPPSKGIFKYMAPYIHHIWISACSEGGDP